MLRLFRRKTPARLTVAFVTLLALLVGQGLRLCLHAPDVAEALQAQATAVHLESSLLAPTEPDDATDRHVPLGLGVIKQLADGALAILFAFALAWLLPRPHRRFAFSRGALPLASGDHRLRPPLRAPPF